MSRRTNTSRFGWRRRGAVAVALTSVSLLTFLVVHAFADAGNPILSTIHGTVVPDNPANPNGGVTVYVRGQWNWLSHNSDCNFDRAGTGVAIAWNDPQGADRTRTITTATRAGTTVTLTVAAQTFDVGDHITVAGVTGGTGYNGTFVVTARDNTHVKYTSAGTGSGSGGTVTDNDIYNGWKVQKSPITAYVGTQTATPGNPVDNMVHPVDRGNQVEGYTSGTWKSTTQGYTTNAAGDYPSGQAFVDPASNNPSDFATWKGGCGREPITATASQGGGNPESTGNACGTTPASTVCASEPWGSWGYEKNGGLGYSHHFAKRSDLTTVCANFYDVHGGGKFNSGKFQSVNSANEITVTANGDNSVQTNAFNTAQGANCFSFSQGTPTIATTATGGTIGDSISDSATITGLVSPTGSGSITFTAYAPKADGTADTSCTTPVYTKTVTGIAADGSYGSGSLTPSGTAPQIAGIYEWIASFGGDATNLPVTGACGDAGEQSVLQRHSSSVPTAQKILISDYVKVSATNGTPTGNVTFQLFTDATCASGSKVFDSGPVQLVNGLAHADDPTPLGLNGTYYWLASYGGDANYAPAASPCGAEQTTVSGNTPGIAP
jgi:hypothetical protein